MASHWWDTKMQQNELCHRCTKPKASSCSWHSLGALAEPFTVVLSRGYQISGIRIGITNNPICVTILESPGSECFW